MIGRLRQRDAEDRMRMIVTRPRTDLLGGLDHRDRNVDPSVAATTGEPDRGLVVRRLDHADDHQSWRLRERAPLKRVTQRLARVCLARHRAAFSSLAPRFVKASATPCPARRSTRTASRARSSSPPISLELSLAFEQAALGGGVPARAGRAGACVRAMSQRLCSRGRRRSSLRIPRSRTHRTTGLDRVDGDPFDGLSLVDHLQWSHSLGHPMRNDPIGRQEANTRPPLIGPDIAERATGG